MNKAFAAYQVWSFYQEKALLQLFYLKAEQASLREQDFPWNNNWQAKDGYSDLVIWQSFSQINKVTLPFQRK